jgi:glycogen synthase
LVEFCRYLPELSGDACLKLLIYSYDWAPLVGGVQSVTTDLAREICEWSKVNPGRAFDVTLVTETPVGDSSDLSVPFRVIRRPSLLKLLGQIHSADVVHLANPALRPLALAWLLRKPTVVEHHGYHAICPNGLLLYKPSNSICPGYFMAGDYRKCIACCSQTEGKLRSLRNLLLTFARRWLCQRVSANVAVTDHVATRVCLAFTQRIYHGVSDHGLQVRTDKSASAANLEIGYVGRFVEEKGVPLLLEASKKLADNGFAFHLTLIGDGSMREKLEIETDHLRIRDRVTFTGYLEGLELRKALQKIPVLVMPSQCEETAGLAVMEHMMRGGVPIVADIGGLREVVGEAGLKFTAGNSDSLYLCLRELAEDHSKIGALSVAARTRAEVLFSLPVMIDNHLALYRQLCG